MATIEGTNFSETLVGTAGADIINGRGGDDTLLGGEGADIMNGGPGDDSYFVDTIDDIVLEAIGEGRDRVYTSASYILRAGVEVELLLTANQSGTGSINLTGNEFANILYGNDGANILAGGGGGDVLLGFAGDDNLDGGLGNDTLSGGLGDDIYHVDSAGDVIVENAGEGRDMIFSVGSYNLRETEHVELLLASDQAGTAAINLSGNSLDNILYGNAGANILIGGAGNDVLLGFAGNDSLNGGAGADVMNGGMGDDTYFIDSVDDVIVEQAGEGRDTLFVSNSYILRESESIEVIVADGAAPIAIFGNSQDNIIYGKGGANSLDGREGNDVLIGLGGPDEFVFSTPPSDSTNMDTILDFQVGIDRIVLDDRDDPFYLIGTGSGPLPSYAFVTGSQAQTTDTRIIYNPQTGALMFDMDGSNAGAAVQFALLAPGLALQASDIMVLTERGPWDY